MRLHFNSTPPTSTFLYVFLNIWYNSNTRLDSSYHLLNKSILIIF